MHADALFILITFSIQILVLALLEKADVFLSSLDEANLMKTANTLMLIITVFFVTFLFFSLETTKQPPTMNPV